MRELAVELKQLRMHGMASAWSDLVEQGGSAGPALLWKRRQWTTRTFGSHRRAAGPCQLGRDGDQTVPQATKQIGMPPLG